MIILVDLDGIERTLDVMGGCTTYLDCTLQTYNVLMWTSMIKLHILVTSEEDLVGSIVVVVICVIIKG